MMAGKASKKFDLGELTRALAGPVSESDTMRREQIEYIDIDRIDSDPENFYSLSGIDALAADIETIGLQQPLRVRPGENGHVVIVSGHRRCAAMRMLVESGREDLREIPCILERGDVSPALQELRLIYANAHTRALTSAEVSQQAERVERLLYQLKEEGYEFPGRMRDHVAEACQVSKTKLARLKVIREQLAPDIKKPYWDGPKEKCLSEASAYALARLPADIQRQVVDAYRKESSGNHGLMYLREGMVNKVAEQIKRIDNLPRCMIDGGECIHKDVKCSHGIRILAKSEWTYVPCGNSCCEECRNLESCKDVCPRMKEKQQQLKAASRDASRAEKLEREERERPGRERVQAIWSRFGLLRNRAGLEPKAYLNKINCPYMGLREPMEAYEKGAAKLSPESDLPFGYHVTLTDVSRWSAAADALGCSVDYLMMRTDDPRPAAAQPPGQMVLAAWMPGALTPPEPCDVVADLQLADLMQIRKLLHWDGSAFRFRRGGEKVEVDVIRWLRLPETEEEND